MLSPTPKSTTLIIAALLLICTVSFAQYTDPYAINRQIGRGINLGNALEAPSEGEWGITLEERYFDLIEDAGFDSIRLPVRWNAHAMEDAPYTIDRDFFRRVDWAVDNALDRNLPIIVNIHHYNALDQDPEGHMDRFLALWKQIAEHYKDKPNTLVFELMNEPHDKLNATAWNMILKKAIEVIRESNPTRTLMVGPVQWNQIAYLKNLKLPEDDDNIIVTVHYYSPMKFTHQGASWAADSNEWLGTKWTGSEEEKKAVTSDFDTADAWASEYDRPLHLGEFGAYSAADMQSRARWTRFIADSAIERGWSFSYWEFCSGFGVYDPDKREWREPLLDALLPNR
jgi:endoglucanase